VTAVTGIGLHYAAMARGVQHSTAECCGVSVEYSCAVCVQVVEEYASVVSAIDEKQWGLENMRGDVPDDGIYSDH
jgi:hypothetical protein